MRSLRVLLLWVLLMASAPVTLWAQQGSTFIQIQAVPTLDQARTRARAYAGAFPNVNGFALPNGWYAIALGPYVATVAAAEIGALKRERLIPLDSYITRASSYRRQFWPDGTTPQIQVQPAPTAPAVALPPPQIADETPREARQSEARLTGTERKFLQEALQWFGFYTSAIDGAFGRGTRGSMAAWQTANGHEATGVLTTGQRQELADSYREVFKPFGLATIRNEEAGVDLLMPLGKVAYARTEAPFIQYDSTDDSGLRVMLISQAGDAATLFGLYDIMQTLEIVPETGPRERKRTEFTLTGTSDDLNSYTYARLTRSGVKGFSLIWPPGEDPRIMDRVRDQMRASFQTVSGQVLPDTALSGDGSDQRVDLLAGLEIRKPLFTRSGVFVDRNGTVLTSAAGLAGCGRLTLNGTAEATLAATEDGLGLAALQPVNSLTPQAVAGFQTRIPRLRSEVAVAGFSYGDVMDQPVLTYGALADIRGLAGETELHRLELEALPGDAGGAVIDSGGALLGILQARPEGGSRRLPDDVNFAVNAAAIAEFLANAGLIFPQPATGSGAPLDPVDISRQAAKYVVQVNCWE